MTVEKGTTGHKLVRPRDASAILLLDRSGSDIRVLVGKRSTRHAFMPDLYVFPGGRRDSADNRHRPVADYHPETQAKLAASLGHAPDSRLRGFGICALRELHEETGLLAGGSQFKPDLSVLRYIARAITPPGGVRRFDTQFFACFCDELGLAPDALRDSDELTDLKFIPVADSNAVPMPEITRRILGELHSFVTLEPSLRYSHAVPWYRRRGGHFVRTLIAESET